MIERNTIEVVVHFGDCDPAGIVFYPHYFEWFEWACWSLFEAADMSRKQLVETYGICGWPLISSQSQFRAPATEGDRLAVTAEIAHWGNSSFQLRYIVRRGETLICEGVEHRIWAGWADEARSKLAPMRVPDAVRERLPAQAEPAVA